MVARTPTSAASITREQLNQAFKNLGKLEAAARRDLAEATVLGDSIAAIMHVANTALRRRESRRTRRRIERAAIEYHEAETLGAALLAEVADRQQGGDCALACESCRCAVGDDGFYDSEGMIALCAACVEAGEAHARRVGALLA